MVGGKTVNCFYSTEKDNHTVHAPGDFAKDKDFTILGGYFYPYYFTDRVTRWAVLDLIVQKTIIFTRMN